MKYGKRKRPFGWRLSWARVAHVCIGLVFIWSAVQWWRGRG